MGAITLRRSDHHTGTIALLLEDVGNYSSPRPCTARWRTTREHGVQVLTGSLDEDPQRRTIVRAFTMRRADGLIIAAGQLNQGYLAAEVEAETPVVFVDRPGHGMQAATVLASTTSWGGRGHPGPPSSRTGTAGSPARRPQPDLHGAAPGRRIASAP